MTQRLTVIAIALLTSAVCKATIDPCRNVRLLTSPAPQVDTALLAQAPIARLGLGVYRVSLPDSTAIVIRLSKEEGDIEFESFAAQMMTEAGLWTPTPTRLTLSQEITEPLMTLEQRDASLGPEASMVRFVPGATGETTLSSLGGVPDHLTVKLADHWALWTVLGISDFHANNWLFLDGEVISIDLANRSAIFERGIPTIQWLVHSYPFGDYSTPELQATLRVKISATVRNFLKTLDEATVMQIAAKTSFVTSEKIISGIVARARAFTE